MTASTREIGAIGLFKRLVSGVSTPDRAVQDLVLSQLNDVAPETAGKSAGPKPTDPKRKKIAFIALVSVVAVVLTVAGSRIFAWVFSHEETDDAYVVGHIHAISSRVEGTVEQVLVDDNEHVIKGQVLLILDPNDFKVKLDQAKASLAEAERQAESAQSSIRYSSTSAQAQKGQANGSIASAQAAIARAKDAVIEAQAVIPQTEHQLQQSEAELIRAEKDNERFVDLEKQGAVTTSEKDRAVRDFQVAQASRAAAIEMVHQAHSRLEQAKDNVRAGQAQLLDAQSKLVQAQAAAVQTDVSKSQYDVTRASVAAAKAQLENALLQLSYTKIVAPATGRVGKKTVEVGHRVQQGQPLLAVVSDDVWVVANFKETQLEKMHPGQKVELTVDSFPHHHFIGTLQSFSPGSGANFALLPPDNATGNFTKIVQRLPVKIVFDPDSIAGYQDRLVPGLSAVVTVSVK